MTKHALHPRLLVNAGLFCSLLALASGVDADTLAAPATPASTDSARSASITELTLAHALELALQYNHDLQAGRIAVSSAEAGSTIAGAAPNPTLTIQTANINPRLGVGPGSLRNKTVDSTFRIDQLIERGGKRELRIESAAHLEKASRLDLNDTERQLRQAVNGAYFDLLAAQHKLRISNETRDLFKITMQAANQRKKLGDIAGADTARVRVDALRAENDARQAAADLLHAQSALLSLLGMKSAPAGVIAISNWPQDHASISAVAIEDALRLRPDVKAAQARVDAATAARKLAVAAKTRDVSVGVQFEHYPVSATNTQGSGNSYGVSVQIPLFARYQFQGEIRAAEAAVDAAQENLDKTIDAARSELQVAFETLAASKELTQRFQIDLLPAARQSAEAAEYAFKHGAIPVMDVLDARRTYRATEMDAINAQTEYAKAYAMLSISLEEWNKK